MRFGIALENFTTPGRLPSVSAIYETAKLAESLGFDSVWVWDHLLLGSRKVFPVLDSLTTLASIGARTAKIGLGTSVLIMALRNPVVLAKVLSTIQYMTGGRLVVGAAAGWYKREFDATGTDFSKRGAIFEERYRLVRSLLTQSDVNYKEGGYDLEHASMEPKAPVPMLLGGYAPAVLDRAGRISDGWIGYYYPPDAFKESFGKVLAAARSAGRDERALRSVNVVPLALAESFEEGDALVKDFTAKYMDLPKNTRCSVESGVRGSVSDCTVQIREYEEAGVQELVFIPVFYDIAQVEKAGRDILGLFK